MIGEMSLKAILAEPADIDALHIPQNIVIDLIFRILFNEGNVIKNAMRKKYKQNVLKKLDDSLEQKARESVARKRLVYNCCMKINVNHIATLANLKLSSEEETKLEKQLEEILAYVEKLEEVNTENIEETSQVTGLENILRADEAKNCELTQEEAISGSTAIHNGLFKVKGVLPNE